jgi:hypothetical protein
MVKYMWCGKCGNQLAEGDLFCDKCGAPTGAGQQETGGEAPAVPKEPAAMQPEAEEPAAHQAPVIELQVPPAEEAPKAAPESAGPRKLRIPPAAIAAAAIVVVVALAGLTLFLKLGSVPASSGSITMFSSDGDIVVSAGGSPKFSLNAKEVNRQSSLDGSVAAVIADPAPDGSGELYLLTSKGKTFVSDGVYSFQLADSGKGIAYLTDYDGKGNTATLHLYDCASNKSARIAGEVTAMSGSGVFYCISPDGRSVGYIADLDVANREFNGYLKINGSKPEKLGGNMFAMALANNGAYVYYYKMDKDSGADDLSLCVRKGEEDTKLIPQTDSNTVLYFNGDYTQVLFSYDGKTYLSRNGRDKEKIAGKAVTAVIRPQFAGGAAHTGIESYDLKNFANVVLSMDDGSLLYVDGKGESSTVTGSYLQAAVTENGGAVFMVSTSGTLFRRPLTLDGVKEQIAGDVVSFAVTKDGRGLYYVNSDEELFFVSGSSKPKKVADDVSSSLCLTADGGTLYFFVDYSGNSGTLYSSRNGGKRAKVSDDAYGVFATASGVFYCANYSSSSGTYDVYRSAGGSQFKLFQSDVVGIR